VRGSGLRVEPGEPLAPGGAVCGENGGTPAVSTTLGERTVHPGGHRRRCPRDHARHQRAQRRQRLVVEDGAFRRHVRRSDPLEHHRARRRRRQGRGDELAHLARERRVQPERRGEASDAFRDLARSLDRSQVPRGGQLHLGDRSLAGVSCEEGSLRVSTERTLRSSVHHQHRLRQDTDPLGPVFLAAGRQPRTKRGRVPREDDPGCPLERSGGERRPADVGHDEVASVRGIILTRFSSQLRDQLPALVLRHRLGRGRRRGDEHEPGEIADARVAASGRSRDHRRDLAAHRVSGEEPPSSVRSRARLEALHGGHHRVGHGAHVVASVVVGLAEPRQTQRRTRAAPCRQRVGHGIPGASVAAEPVEGHHERTVSASGVESRRERRHGDCSSKTRDEDLRPRAAPVHFFSRGTRPIRKNSAFGFMPAKLARRLLMPKNAVIEAMSQMSSSSKPWTWSAA
jgi:hypothetical protein